jgi:Domain of unknown function (DUF4278)
LDTEIKSIIEIKSQKLGFCALLNKSNLQEETMRLTYRGVSYERQPLSLEVTEGEIGGQYRGQTWRHHYPRHIPNLKPKPYVLQYRGVAYCTQPTLLPGPRIGCHTESVSRQEFKKSIERLFQPVVDEAQQIHLENIRRRLEHRLQVAKIKGDETLIHQLEEESRQLALNA